MKKVFISLIRFYQRFISPMKRKSTCIFMPTCSQYAIEAIEERGVIIGICLTIWRILRCNPFNNHGGYDPVPPKKARQNKEQK